MGFLIIGLVGAAVLVVLQFFGHDGNGVHDTDAGHFSVDEQASGPSPLSLRTVSIFLMLFGFAGWLSLYYHQSVAASSAVGVLAGLAAASLAYMFFRLLYLQQGDSTPAFDQFVGLEAQVITAIPEDGIGEVSLVWKGQNRTVLARSTANIPLGHIVRVMQAFGDSVVVEPRQHKEGGPH